MKILAIETSCDETAIAVLETKNNNVQNRVLNILSNVVASQVKIHAPWGGVVPNLAKREHQKNLPIVLKKALKQAKISVNNPKIDLIAVTNGPGLEPALWVGITFAQNLAQEWNKPLIGINHLEGHIFSVFLQRSQTSLQLLQSMQFPVLALIVSGGHTELVLMRKWLNYKVIGQTLDDASGEAFDKVAKMLKLGYPGGPAISKIAKSVRSPTPHTVNLPRPMINSKDYNFSFSGLKTAVLYLLRDLEKQAPNLYKRDDLISAICAEFQQAAIDVLIKKTIRAAKEYKAKTIILGGGVTANQELRKQLKKAVAETNFENSRWGRAKFYEVKFGAKEFSKFGSREKPILLMPKMEFTGDNAAMIALAAYFRAQKGKARQMAGAKIPKIVANSNLELS